MNLHLLVALVLASTGTAAAIFALGWQACLHWTERPPLELAAPLEQPDLIGRVGLSRAGYFDLPGALAASYGPFPADTGPLLIWSEKTAALDAHEWEVREMIAEANRRIGPVQ